MNVHVTTGRWRLGLALSVVTALLWGVLPIALKALLEYMDVFTIIWYRFSVAAAFLFVFVIRKNGLPTAVKIRRPVMFLLAAAALGLCGNYILYIVGLDHLSPSTATVVIQLAPMFMLLGSLIVFRERFGTGQWVGFAVLVAGLMLFFNNRLDELVYRLTNYTTGVLLITAAAVSWAMYALAQKQLLRSFSSESIMLFIYSMGVLVFLPFARPAGVAGLDGTGLLLLVFCAFNTLIAYGSFAEALDHWEASRVSMILATTPLITMAAMKLCTVMFPGFAGGEQLNYLSVAGGVLVVAGSITSSLSGTGSRVHGE
ncbi:MAG: DMT family transporter [Deferribacteres bacterium]|nr:DMT family transporter [Deferribacteres bacterium]